MYILYASVFYYLIDIFIFATITMKLNAMNKVLGSKTRVKNSKKSQVTSIVLTRKYQDFFH
jgi:hypothetical protein